MPRNGSGTYELPLPNVAAGTSIQSSWANTTLGDIATALTNSIAKDGETVWTGVDDHNGNEIILDVDGDTSITADTDDQIDFKVGGADRVSMGSTALTSYIPVSVGTLSLTDGSITDSSGSISFGDEAITTGGAITMNTPSSTSTVLTINASMNSGRGLHVISGNSNPSSRTLMLIENVNSAATGATLLQLGQNANQGFINFGGESGASTSAPISTLTTPGSIQGFVQVLIGGTKRWIPYYSDPS